MRKYHVEVNGMPYEVVIREITGDIDDSLASIESEQISKKPAVLSTDETVTAPMPGTILKVNIVDGQMVKAGDVLMFLEAMKMENEIMASKDGKISNIQVREGSSVESGDVLCIIS